MVPRIRVLVPALIAVVALGAVTASAAQAGEFTAEKYPATMTGTQLGKHQFKFEMGTVTCNSALFDGSLAAASSVLTLEAEYGECKTGGGAAVTVEMTSCDYRLHANETIEAGRVDGSLDVECGEGGDAIDFIVPASGCKVRVPSQTGLNTLVYTDNVMAKDFDVDIGIEGMTYEQGAFCGGGAGVFGTGQYMGKSTISADFGGGATGTTVD
jgi:hypothetical protein